MTFLKKVKIDESSIPDAGLGVFADEDIQKEEIIYVEDNLKIITKERIIKILDDNPSQEVLDSIFIHGQFNSELGLLIIHTDRIRFINHSDNDFNVYYGRATKFIKKGQELLENYNDVDEGAWFKNLSKKYSFWDYSDITLT